MKKHTYSSHAVTNHGEVISQTAGKLTEITAHNKSARSVVVKLFNARRNPVAGTDTPRFVVTVAAGEEITVKPKKGLEFSIGMAIAVVTGHADADTGTTVAGQTEITAQYEGGH